MGTLTHYDDVIMGSKASQITSLTIVYSTVYSGADQSNIKAPRHKWPVTRKMFPFDDIIMTFIPGTTQRRIQKYPRKRLIKHKEFIRAYLIMIRNFRYENVFTIYNFMC